jgi:hypothetical protein
MLLAMSLAEALETTRLPRVADRHIPCVSTRPFRASHPTLADVGWIGGGQMPMPGEVSLAHHGLLCLNSNAMCWRCCGSRSRRASYEYNLPHVLDLAALVVFAARVARPQRSLIR